MACSLLRPPSLRGTALASYSHPILFSSPSTPANQSISFFNLNRPYLNSSISINFQAPFPRFRAASPDTPPPPDEDLVRSSGLDVKFLRLKDTVQIFFAVLFWMSLFFWACVWDDKNNGNPTKGSRFKR